jgi:hypothetical protein
VSIPGPSPRRHGFDSRSVHVGFEVDEVALGKWSFCVKYGVPNISIMPPMVDTHLHLDTTPYQEKQGPYTQSNALCTQVLPHNFKGLNSNLCHKYTLASIATEPGPNDTTPKGLPQL